MYHILPEKSSFRRANDPFPDVLPSCIINLIRFRRRTPEMTIVPYTEDRIPAATLPFTSSTDGW